MSSNNSQNSNNKTPNEIATEESNKRNATDNVIFQIANGVNPYAEQFQNYQKSPFRYDIKYYTEDQFLLEDKADYGFRSYKPICKCKKKL